jgi:hypothetical protein
MQALTCAHAILAIAIITGAVGATYASADDYESWAVLRNPFPSTGGGGIMIADYNPVVVGSKCVTDFRAIEPGGTTYHNIVEFDAIETNGGILCANGAWRAVDGSSSGTTPLRVFMKNGVVRRSP